MENLQPNDLGIFLGIEDVVQIELKEDEFKYFFECIQFRKQSLINASENKITDYNLGTIWQNI